MRPTLRIGSHGEDAKDLQTYLISLGILKPPADGIFGPATDRAVKEFQKINNLVVDGIVGARSWQLIDNGVTKELYLRDSDYEEAAKLLQCEVAAIKAVGEVESAGNGFLPSGQPAILFERHWMARRLATRGLHLARELGLAHRKDIVNTSTGGYRGGIAEYERFDDAYALNNESAIESASWGRFQIMGFHWERLGYDSPEHMKSEMEKTEREHLMAFVRFIQTDRTLLNAIRKKDWTTFARSYNGPQFHVNDYDNKMAAAYKRIAQ